MFCGAKARPVCPACGTELPEVAKFCFKCGTQVKRPAQAQTVQPSVLNAQEMNRLSEIKKQAAEKVKGAPVWDRKSDGGVCDCAVGECDCDGSIWS